MNNNFSAITAWANGNIDHTNLSASAGILVSQLNLAGGALNLVASGTIPTWGSGITGDSVARVTMYGDGTIGFGVGGAAAQDTFIWRSGANALTISGADGSGSGSGLTIGGLTCTTVTASGALSAAAISGTTVSGTGALSSGANGGTAGSLILKGSTSGQYTQQAAAVAGTPTFTMPTAVPTFAGGTGVTGNAMLGATSAGVQSYQLTPPRFSSVGNAWTAGGSVGPLTHNLGAVPHKIWATFVCTTAQNGYSVGDEVTAYATGNNTASGWGLSFRATSTQITVYVGTNGVLAYNVTAGSGAMISLLAADWTMSVFAEP